MALNIKDAETERLAAQVAAMAGESKTKAVRNALRERKERLALTTEPTERMARLTRYLEREVWPKIPKSVRGKRISKRERERILGYGPHGV
jgi:antitoxin VapB